MIKLTPEKPPYYEQGVAVKTYTALISQSATDAPTTIIIGNNTLGQIIWTRSTNGVYIGTLDEAFKIDKTWLTITNNSESPTSIYAILRIDADTINIRTSDGSEQDDMLTKTPIKIEVYV